MDDETPAAASAKVSTATVVYATRINGTLSLEGLSVRDDEVAAGDEFDLVDCGGWLARARLIAADAKPYGWRVELIETVAAAPPVPCRSDKGWSAFAVTPSDPSRPRIRDSAGDPGAAFATLPDDVLAWHQTMLDAYGRSTAGPSEWADLDGDGVIDLLHVEGKCKPSDDYICGQIFVAEHGAWRVVGRTTPL